MHAGERKAEFSNNRWRWGFYLGPHVGFLRFVSHCYGGCFCVPVVFVGLDLILVTTFVVLLQLPLFGSIASVVPSFLFLCREKRGIDFKLGRKYRGGNV